MEERGCRGSGIVERSPVISPCYTGSVLHWSMANLTISVDDATLKRARLRALQRDESVNAYLAERDRQRAEVRAEVERRFPAEGLRERLLARLV